MNNKDIVKQLSGTISLFELHGENEYKIKSFRNAVFTLEKSNVHLQSLSLKELEAMPSIGKSIARVVHEITTNGEARITQELKKSTPVGLLELLKLRGIGAKKLRILWVEAGVTSAEELIQKINQGKLIGLKGFGTKTITNIMQIAEFALEVRGYEYYALAEKWAIAILEQVKAQLKACKIEVCGKLRRKWEMVNKLEFVIAYDNPIALNSMLDELEDIEKNRQTSGLFTWRGVLKAQDFPVEFNITTIPKFYTTLFLKTGAPKHINYTANGISLKQIAEQNLPNSEEEIYSTLNLSYCEPEIREGTWELSKAKDNTLPKLITENQLNGVLHNHTTYSDGAESLETMAKACINKGFSYLGISDHSKAANFYANGMFEDTVAKQQEEIDILNNKLAPFKIFKGIEADILADGSLDYNAQTLSTFDFVVASIHSGLQMDETKATNRLLTAIANPFTTILGHPTGRILLLRRGYPINHKAIIDACATYGVIIEINANPKRLDLDWRWINYALEKKVTLSINPDAHSIKGLQDMYYGVCTGRKGGLSKENTFNSWTKEKVEAYFEDRKKQHPTIKR